MGTYGTQEWANRIYGNDYYRQPPVIEATARRVTQSRIRENAREVAMQSYYDVLRKYKYGVGTGEIYDQNTGFAYQEHGVPMKNPYVSKLYNTYLKQLTNKYGR